MGRTIGDIWRECNNTELATQMVDFVVAFFTSMGIDERDIDITKEYQTFLDFFNTPVKELPKRDSNNGYSYLN
jgi:hypothetical protein